MSLKYFNDESQKWKKVASLLASSIQVVDIEGNFNNNNIEDCLKEISQELDFKIDDIAIELHNGKTVMCLYSNSVLIKRFEFNGANEDIYVGEAEPTGNSLVWIDTSDITDSSFITDTILEEIKGTFSFLQSQLDDLKKKNRELEARVLYLEQNGGGGGKPDPEPDPTINDVLIFEDGLRMVFEDGSVMVFEDNSAPPSNSVGMVFEDGSVMLFEDGSKMIFENELNIPVGTVLTFEDMQKMIFEDSKYLTFE